MVNIESMSEDAKNLEERIDTLTALASEITGMEIFPFGPLINFKNNEDGRVDILADIKHDNSVKIGVYSPDKLEIAINFAEIYERRTNEKVTVKKEYKE